MTFIKFDLLLNYIYFFYFSFISDKLCHIYYANFTDESFTNSLSFFFNLCENISNQPFYMIFILNDMDRYVKFHRNTYIGLISNITINFMR